MKLPLLLARLFFLAFSGYQANGVVAQAKNAA